MKPPEIIETPRLSLRRPIAADATAIFEGYAQDPEVTRYLPWQPHKQIHETFEFLDRCAAGWDDSSEFTWVLVRKPDCQLLGMVALRVGQYKFEVHLQANPPGAGARTDMRSMLRQCDTPTQTTHQFQSKSPE
jgi:RimJ/RimL family protein N-acetyltransferase